MGTGDLTAAWEVQQEASLRGDLRLKHSRKNCMVSRTLKKIWRKKIIKCVNFHQEYLGIYLVGFQSYSTYMYCTERNKKNVDEEVGKSDDVKSVNNHFGSPVSA
jgi:hypothetical protein